MAMVMISIWKQMKIEHSSHRTYHQKLMCGTEECIQIVFEYPAFFLFALSSDNLLSVDDAFRKS